MNRINGRDCWMVFRNKDSDKWYLRDESYYTPGSAREIAANVGIVMDDAAVDRCVVWVRAEGGEMAVFGRFEKAQTVAGPMAYYSSSILTATETHAALSAVADSFCRDKYASVGVEL